MESDNSADEIDVEDFYAVATSEAEDSDQSSGSDIEKSPSDELLHSCLYCSKLKLDWSNCRSDESGLLHGNFSLDVDEMVYAASHGCDFLARFVEPVESLLKPRLSKRQTPASRKQCEIGDLGVVMSIAGNFNSRRFEAEMRWTKRDGAFACPVGNESGDYISTSTTKKCNPEILSDAFQQVRHRLRRCHEMHPCAKPDFAPLRLIRIQGDGHVVLETPANTVPKYAALSYCWGRQKTFTADRRRLPNMVTGISIKKLPKTIRDAIYVTQQLQLQYLWVDSLCIVQDDLNEKYFQISQMPQIYRGAYVTIAASRARECSEGFLNTEEKIHALYKLPCMFSDQLTNITLATRVSFPKDPLDTRAWALQERMLSPRLLDFRSCELYYGCQLHHESFDLSTGQSKVLRDVSSMMDSAQELAKNNFRGQSANPKDISAWHSAVEDYSHRNLSFPEDKLLAISGIADQFVKEAVIDVDDRYLGGLWGKALPKDLLWVCLNPRKRPDKYRSPSWSWAAVDGEISYDFSNYHKKKNEREIETWDYRVSLMLEDSKYGALLQSPPGRLCVSGLIKPAELVQNRTKLRDSDNRRELYANVYVDALDFNGIDDIEQVYLLNFWQPAEIDRIKVPKKCEGIANLTPIGFILTRTNNNANKSEQPGLESQLSEERYSRVGLYHGTCSKSWFLDSERRTVILL